MTDSWVASETNTHQDHVVAHVLGARILGYFIFNEAIYILLDIGFIWTILLDGEMGLLPHPVATSELEIDDQSKEGIKADIELLLHDNQDFDKLQRVTPVLNQNWELSSVSIFQQGERRRLVLSCEAKDLAIETSLTTGEIDVYELEQTGF